MKFSLRSIILLSLMVVGLFIAGLGLGANIRSKQPESIIRSQTREGRLTPIAGYLLWGGLALVFGCLVPLSLDLARQAKDKAAS